MDAADIPGVLSPLSIATAIAFVNNQSLNDPLREYISPCVVDFAANHLRRLFNSKDDLHTAEITAT